MAPKLTNRNAFSNCDIPHKQNGITYPTHHIPKQVSDTYPKDKPFIAGNTSGLLGYWDDSKETEFLKPDGTFLNTNSSLEIIHRDFGQLCT